MLHGFNSSTGAEVLAYIPNKLFPNLPKLSDKSYSHTNFVDGQLVEGDAYFSTGWRTVLTGGLGYGGQGIFALDVTNPANFTENQAANIALWEFTDLDDPDLGYTYGKPLIKKLNSGQWAAIFGNGYDNTAPDSSQSATGDAAIYIVNIEDGSLIKKISFNTGSIDDPTGAARANGITSIQAVDVNADYMVDFLYAGDIFGNVWRINLQGNKAKWDVAFSGQPLYKALDSLGNAQPITTITPVGHHRSIVGLMVYFGTGKYLGVNDIIDTSQQTFYGIWDRWFDTDADTIYDESDFTPIYRNDLLEQEVLGVNSTQFGVIDARITTNYPIDWEFHKGWLLDLTESGERVFQDPFLRNDRVIFVTVTPSNDPCLAGGTSWLMELDANSGGRLEKSPFDYDLTGTFTLDDQVSFDVDGDGSADKVGGSGIRLDASGGIYTSPAVLKLPQRDNERKYMATSHGNVEVMDESSGRRLKQSWREIKGCGI
jgi:type IV pilus assembly protein PilY1